jgi:cytochrome c2
MSNETMNKKSVNNGVIFRSLLTDYRLPPVVLSGTAYCLLRVVLNATAYCLLLVGCIEGFTNAGDELVVAGDPEQGREAIYAYGCGSCHQIPGVPSANATVGPPLENWANRYYIAGTLTNTPDNLITWIRNPQGIEPGTAMPNLDVTEQEARDMAAYLYTLDDD